MDQLSESFVGAMWQGAFPKSYWRHFNLIELPLDKVGTLKQKTVSKWFKGAPDETAIAVPHLSVDGSVSDEVVQSFMALSSLSQRGELVVQTPSDFRPTQGNIARISKSLTRLITAGVRVSWRADGLWEDEHCEQLADSLGCGLVVDPLDEALDERAQQVPYFYSVRGRRGFQNQLTDYELSRIQQRLASKPGCLSFGLTGFWGDALRYVDYQKQQDRFWD